MDLNQMACSIIAHAGDGHSYATEAINLAKEGKFEEAKEMLKKSDESILEAHKIHTKLLIETAQKVDEIHPNFLMIHASNHLSEARCKKDLADMMVYLLEKER